MYPSFISADFSIQSSFLSSRSSVTGGWTPRSSGEGGCCVEPRCVQVAEKPWMAVAFDLMGQRPRCIKDGRQAGRDGGSRRV